MQIGMGVMDEFNNMELPLLSMTWMVMLLSTQHATSSNLPKSLLVCHSTE
jgi:hypothetical protein